MKHQLDNCPRCEAPTTYRVDNLGKSLVCTVCEWEAVQVEWIASGVQMHNEATATVEPVRTYDVQTEEYGQGFLVTLQQSPTYPTKEQAEQVAAEINKAVERSAK